MKFKSLLKIGLPLLGTTTLAVSLPLALTSCSDSESNNGPISFEQNLAETTKVSKNQNYLELSVKASTDTQGKQLAYQWYVKEPTKTEDQSLVKLSDNEDKKDPLEGFKEIKTSTNPTANTSTLQLAADIDLANGYEFVVAVWEENAKPKADENSSEEIKETPKYKFSNVTKIEVNKNSTLNVVNDVTVDSTGKLNISSLETLNGILESDGKTVKPDSDFFKNIATELGFKADTIDTNKYPAILKMQLIKQEQVSNDKEVFNLQINLANGYTWDLEIFQKGEPALQKTKTNSFKLDDNQNLVIENLVSGIEVSKPEASSITATYSDDGAKTVTEGDNVTITASNVALTGNNTGATLVWLFSNDNGSSWTKLENPTNGTDATQTLQLNAVKTAQAGKYKLAIMPKGQTEVANAIPTANEFTLTVSPKVSEPGQGDTFYTIFKR